MPSDAFNLWATIRAAELDQIENAHRSVGGRGPGRRYATQQINHAYAMLLSAQFQGFCRDLHTEAAKQLVSTATPAALQPILRTEFVLNRWLDRGNPNPANIAADFDRLGVPFWVRIDAHDARNSQRRRFLEELNQWRNAIAHQHFDPAKLGGRTTLALHQVRAYRIACSGLAASFDEVLRLHIHTITGTWPW